MKVAHFRNIRVDAAKVLAAMATSGWNCPILQEMLVRLKRQGIRVVCYEFNVEQSEPFTVNGSLTYL